ncbi:glutamate-5-semialdehyde dehydrogenase [Paludibacter sp. 221]|uniref:glutamate-5-semialdehyde dehydrogenase n=1 Tax=Paludibacter sp. 221 TaxID=2302939 RepID=UPI0013D00CE3|nr:glutamate-5-semialdehyde dehydrogenase [Paludibacter sp. 221]NDV47078.1 glutamate-5-semialdehyde dehydrogenase [Paludibacter sp. 221]
MWKQKALAASRSLNLIDDATINKVLSAIADQTVAKADTILAENAKDLAAMEKSNPMCDRLLLTKERLEGIAADIRHVAQLPSPLGKTLQETTRPNGMRISKISVPFGVVGVVYEARPNVTFDVFSLCFKSGNACVLKGGTDAHNSNMAIVELIQSVLEKSGLDKNIITLLPAGREATQELMNAVGYVDVIIPRGGKGLIEYVRDNSRIPVIETGAGICHTYFDEYGDCDKAEKIVFNAKTRRVSVCNALDCLIIHEKQLPKLPELCKRLADKNVTIYADVKSFTFLNGNYPKNLLQKATDESYGTEFLDYKLAIKTVSSINEAIRHISTYSSKHSECIVSEKPGNIALFDKMVDAACVYTNVSTAFTDGGQFGFGAEIGISTQKLHARGPMALAELCSYKWIIKGDGQTRE